MTSDYDTWAASAFPASAPPATSNDPCPYSSTGQHDWAPAPDDGSGDPGDACTCCCVPR